MRAVSRNGACARAPYTELLEPSTNRGVPAFRAASRTDAVPRAFTSMYAEGRSRLGRTPASAARCTTTSGLTWAKARCIAS